jgi:hypothetical protein
MEGKRDLMEHVAHQCICMQYLLGMCSRPKTVQYNWQIVNRLIDWCLVCLWLNYWHWRIDRGWREKKRSHGTCTGGPSVHLYGMQYLLGMGSRPKTVPVSYGWQNVDWLIDRCVGGRVVEGLTGEVRSNGVCDSSVRLYAVSSRHGFKTKDSTVQLTDCWLIDVLVGL